MPFLQTELAGTDRCAMKEGQGRLNLMDKMNYLFAAYTAIWIILALYLFSIHAREKKLAQEIEHLKKALERQ